MDDLNLVRVNRDHVAADIGPSSSSNGLTRRSKSAPQVRLPNPIPSKLPSRLTRVGRQTPLPPEWNYTTQQAALPRLPESTEEGDQILSNEAAPSTSAAPSYIETREEVPTQFQGLGQKIRVRCYCIGDSFDRLLLQEQIIKRSRTTSVRAFAEVLCSVYNRTGSGVAGDVLYFDFGCIVFWGLDKEAENYVLREIALPCLRTAYPKEQWEGDRLYMLYTTSPKVVMEDDMLCLHYHHAENLEVKLAVSFALAQSTKLSEFEEQMRSMARDLSFLPRSMAEVGEVAVSEKQILQHCGQLYRFVSEVNLLGQVLDMPDTLFDTPTNIKSLYKSVFDYMELEDRIQLLNDRFAVISEMLTILRTHLAQSKFAHLETIIMWLVCLCVVLAVFQLIAFLGWTPDWKE